MAFEQPPKHTRELAHMLAFWRACSDCPSGLLEHEDSPDFRLHTIDRVVGIEHTEIQQPKRESGTLLREQEALRSRVLAKAEERWMRASLPPAMVFVDFHDDIPLRKSALERLTEILLAIAEQNLPPLGGTCTVERDPSNLRVIPKQITRINIYRPEPLTESLWETVDCGYVPTADPSHLQRILTKKEARVHAYRQHCDEVWLLLVADATRLSTWFMPSSGLSEHQFDSSFDCVYLFVRDRDPMRLLTTRE